MEAEAPAAMSRELDVVDFARAARCSYCTKMVAMSARRLGDHRAVDGICDGSGRLVGEFDHHGFAIFEAMSSFENEAHIRYKGVMIDASFNKDGTVEYYVVEGSSGSFYKLADAKVAAEGVAARHPERFR